MTGFDLLDIPMPGPLRLPVTEERLLPGGFRLLAARRGGIPFAELRLNIPFAHADPATAVLLAGAITADPDVLDRAKLLGANLSASADADLLRIGGSAPAECLGELIALLAEVVLAPGYTAAEFRTAMDNAVQVTDAMLASPAHRAVEALNERMFGDHPYGLAIPRPAALRQVSRDGVVSLHHDRVRAAGASLVIAGAIEPGAVLDDIERLLGAWPAGQPARDLRPVPVPEPGSLVVDHPGVTQSLLRVTMPAPRRDAPDYPALSMATMVLGGYFSSRLVQNLREDKGFSYSPRCSLLHVRDADLVTLSVDVVTANTEAMAREITAELANLVSGRPVSGAELDRARRYAAGTLRLRAATLSGLVGVLCDLDLQRLPLEWLRGHDARLAELTPDEVTDAARRYLTPDKALTVWLCDVARAFPAGR